MSIVMYVMTWVVPFPGGGGGGGDGGGGCGKNGGEVILNHADSVTSACLVSSLPLPYRFRTCCGGEVVIESCPLQHM